MTQQVIVVGATPNDGQGTPLRNSFIICNENFSELYARAQVSPPRTLIGTIGDSPGWYAYDSDYFYYCFAPYNGNTQVWAKVSNSGNVSATAIINGTSNITIPDLNAPITVGVNGTANVAIFSQLGVSVGGLLTVSGNVRGGNLQTGGFVSAAGNITTAGNITGNYVFGNGSQLTGLPATYGNANVAAFMPNYTGNLYPTAIYTNTYLYANGQPFSAGGNYTNSNVAAYLPVYTGSLGGTLTNGAQTGITSLGNLSGLNINGASPVVISPVANNITLTTSFGGVITVNPSGTGTMDNMVIGNTTPRAATFTTVSATGNITGSYVLGNGSQLTGLPATYSNANVAAYLPTYSGNISGGNVSATGNITGGNVVAVGNITGSYVLGNGSQLTGLPATYSNANVAAYLPTYSGNISGGNVSATGNINVAGIINGTVDGQLNGLVNGINPTYGTWDFGYVIANTYTNPWQYLFAQTSLGNIDMGTVAAPTALNIDIGTIF